MPPTKPRGWSAAWRTTVPRFGARRASWVRRTRPAALHLRLFCPSGPCFRARTEALRPTVIRAAFAALHPRLVQPLKAAGLSAGGRLPGASRHRGYEPQRRAPHPVPPSGSSLEDAPRMNGIHRIIVSIGLKSRAARNKFCRHPGQASDSAREPGSVRRSLSIGHGVWVPAGACTRAGEAGPGCGDDSRVERLRPCYRSTAVSRKN